jgi:hypothetical protein
MAGSCAENTWSLREERFSSSIGTLSRCTKISDSLLAGQIQLTMSTGNDVVETICINIYPQMRSKNVVIPAVS